MYLAPDIHRTGVSEFPDGHLRAVAVGLSAIPALRIVTGQTIALEWSPGPIVSPGHWGLHYGFVAPRHTAGLLTVYRCHCFHGNEEAQKLPGICQRSLSAWSRI